MPGTVQGGKLAAKTNKEKYGDDFYKLMGQIGGKAKVPKGFAKNPELAKLAGAKGGKISKRTSVKKWR